MDDMDMRERVSALADGQLRGDAMAAAIERVAADAAACEAWHAYHVIGDVMRSEGLAAATPSDRFMARLHESLRAETVLPADVGVPRIASEATATDFTPARPAANDAGPWKLTAGLAALVAVAAIAWSVAAPGADRAAPQLAAAQPAPAAPAAGVVLAGSSAGPMIRDERLDSLLAAHRQLGGATALQSAAPFVRHAAFEAPAR